MINNHIKFCKICCKTIPIGLFETIQYICSMCQALNSKRNIKEKARDYVIY